MLTADTVHDMNSVHSSGRYPEREGRCGMSEALTHCSDCGEISGMPHMLGCSVHDRTGGASFGPGFDSHYGKYSGPLAALTERWSLDGDFGEDSWSNSDMGEGTILYGRTGLSWDDAQYLVRFFDCSASDLDSLSYSLDCGQGILHCWDSQGFLYAWTLDTMSELHDARESISQRNASEVEEA